MTATIFLHASIAQNFLFQRISKAPVKEIFDLYEDKKGFIWVGDNLGVRRYDGLSFKAFTNVSQSSLSMSDFTEDGEGRIWCHNFNGQIFYIENEKMHLLDAYDFTKEKNYPRIVSCGDQIIATSSTGLFVCDTKTLHCKYIYTNNAGTTSLTLIDNKVVLYGNNKWFVYEKGEQLKSLEPDFSTFKNINLSEIVLQPSSYGQDIYAIGNDKAELLTFSFKDNELKLISVKKEPAFINTVSRTKNDVWVNTSIQSESLTSGKVLKGYNISDILDDRNGNIWLSSLQKGLFVKYSSSPLKILQNEEIGTDDFIRCVAKTNNFFIYGSMLGSVIVKDKSQKTVSVFKLPLGAGAVEKLQVFNSDSIFIAASVGIYFFRTPFKELKCVSSNILARDFAVNRNGIFFATPNGLHKEILHGTDFHFKNENVSLLFNKNQRSRAVCFDSSSATLYVAYSDGLYKFSGNSLSNILFKDKPIFASSLAFADNKLFIGSFVGDLFILQGDTVQKLFLHDASVADALIKLKVCGNNLWIFSEKGIKSFNLQQNKFNSIPALLDFKGSDVYDIDEDDKDVFLASQSAIYLISKENSFSQKNPVLYLLYANAGNDTLTNNHPILHSFQNNISFHFAAPYFTAFTNITVSYSLIKQNESDYLQQAYYTNNGSFIINFNALEPGSYTLKARACIDNNYNCSDQLIFKFLIQKPWYQRWWFYCSLVFVIALIFYGIYRYRIRQVLKIENLKRRISADLHDEIGSTLSSINIYSNLAKTEENKEPYLESISNNVTEVVEKLDDLVWKINPKYDTLGSVITRLMFYAEPLAHAKSISINLSVGAGLKELRLDSEAKHHLFLVLKELVNNAVKHSGCQSIGLYFIRIKENMEIIIKDDGNGMESAMKGNQRNGMHNVAYRIQQLQGSLNIYSENGTKVQIIIPAP